MKKLLFIAVIFIISCSKEETPKPNEFKVAQTVTPLPTNTIDITGYWYDYTHVSGGGHLIPVKFHFYENFYYYSEYSSGQWDEIVHKAVFYTDTTYISMPLNTTNYQFFGNVLNDSTIEITQYASTDTLPSYLIHKEQ